MRHVNLDGAHSGAGAPTSSNIVASDNATRCRIDNEIMVRIS